MMNCIIRESIIIHKTRALYTGKPILDIEDPWSRTLSQGVAFHFVIVKKVWNSGKGMDLVVW